MKPFLQVGKIVSTHGIHGELRVQPWCDGPDFLCRFETLYLDEGKTPVRVLRSRVQKNVAIVSLEGVDSVEQGDALRGRVLWIDRRDAALPEGTYFIEDLLGATARDADTGRYYGTLTDVLPTGAADVYEITGDDGAVHLIPAVKEIVVKTDPEAAELLIRPIGGMFGDAD